MMQGSDPLRKGDTTMIRRSMVGTAPFSQAMYLVQ
jgi:hypothetical protein